MKKQMNSRRRTRSRSFNPGHEELAKAMNEFVTTGGHITRLEATDNNLSEFLQRKDERAVDDFLLGGQGPGSF